MATVDILRIKEPVATDESITEYEDLEFNPIAGSNLNDSGSDITITIELKDCFYHPSESYLIVEGELIKDNNTRYANADEVTLTNNGIMYLFKRIRYDLSEKAVETIQHPEQTTTMLGLLKYSTEFSRSNGLNQLWYKDTNPDADRAGNNGFNVRQDYIIQRPNPKGVFSFKIPLKHIFGFCEDYTKIVYGMKHTLIFTRNDDNNAIFRNNAADVGKVVLNKLSWYMPKVMPADKEKMSILKVIEKGEELSVAYRMIQCATAQITQSPSFNWQLSAKTAPEVPRFMIVGFQTGKNNNQEANPAVFDHVNVKGIHCTVNSIRYPKVDYKISFPRFQFCRVYGDSVLFKRKFYNMDELISNPNFTPPEFHDLFPLFVFDFSKQSERLQYATSDIQIDVDFDPNPPANTVGYAVLLSDRLARLQGDGTKFIFEY